MNENTINNDVTIAGQTSVLAGRYRIVRQLGQGGMGSVWLTEDTQLDGKLFAIKMLPSILVSNKRAYNQLKSEALVAMKLVHPNIVQIRAFEENNGNPFLVMDYIDGQTLDDWLGDRGQESGDRGLGLGVSEEEVVRLLKPIAEALDYAHTEGVVHRDVKPANVMIRKDGRPFIMDFGIAREIQETLTRVTGKLSSGTLLYMSPEQLHGAPPNKFQDIYSFAAMVYECLTGRAPFCRGQIEYQIDHDEPEALPQNVAIASSVMRGLAKKHEDRPKSCVDVLKKNVDTVQSVGKNREGERPREPQSEQRVRTTSQGNTFGKIAAIAVFALGSVGGVWYWQGEKAKEEARIDAEQKAEAEREAAEVKADNLDNSKVQLWDGGPYWATKNIGAEKPEDYGYYFWWGDTVGYKRVDDRWVASDGSVSNFGFREENIPTYGKIDSRLKSEGWITADGVLSSQHDAAQKHWGGNWRMPTHKEFEDLNSKCDWSWTQVNGVNGYVVRGKGEYSSKFIFLPCAGYGNGTSLSHAGSDGSFWSSVPGSDGSYHAWSLDVSSGSRYASNYYRYYGQSVRPLQEFTK